MTEVRVEETIAATPLALYDLVSDVTRMGEWSPETASCRWLGGATGPAIGARFRGVNRHGWRRWTTTCTVVAADPGRRFAFDVRSGPLPISRWSYEFEPAGDGCRVTETWTDRRPGWTVPVGAVVMGVPDRAEHNRAGMAATLAALRQEAERADAHRAAP
jgi:hypothetical protein